MGLFGGSRTGGGMIGMLKGPGVFMTGLEARSGGAMIGT